jgi:methionyl-tRNA formyltransferase
MADTAPSREKIVFFGNERIATGVTTDAPTLRGLVEAGYNVVAVISSFQTATSRNARQLEIEAVAREFNIPLLLPSRPADIFDELSTLNADLGVLVAYGRIVPQKIIDLFPRGIVNIHPSLLPLHRGSTPIERAILDGDTQTGVSIMQLAAAMDAGPVWAQETLPLAGNESKPDLAAKLLAMGSSLLIDNLSRILSGAATPEPQDNKLATYDKPLTKADGVIDPSKPAAQIEREIRAYLGWPGSRAQLFDADVIITAAHVAPSTEAVNPKDLILTCGENTQLVIDRLKPAGKREMTGREFLAGHRR